MTDVNNIVPFRSRGAWPQDELERLLAEEAYWMERRHFVRRAREILRES